MSEVFRTDNVAAMTAVAEKFWNAKDMSTTSIKDMATDMCMTVSSVRAAVLMLAERKFLLRIGAASKAESRWRLNPDYPGTLADAIKGKRGAFKDVKVPDREYPKDFKVAGPAYRPPVSKEDWSMKYAEQLNSFAKVAMMARK